jgi:hypothetical protein
VSLPPLASLLLLFCSLHRLILSRFLRCKGMNILVWRRNADDRIILETDAAAIASRVSRPRADTTDIVINEQTVRDACKSSFIMVSHLERGLNNGCWNADNQSRHSGIDCSSVSDSCRYKNRFGEMDRSRSTNRNTYTYLLIHIY